MTQFKDNTNLLNIVKQVCSDSIVSLTIIYIYYNNNYETET